VIFFSAALISTIAALRPAPPEPALGGHDKLAHGLVFLVLSLLLDAAYGHFNMRAAILLAVGGMAVETLQLLQPTRQFSLLDIAANCGGIALYWTGRYWLLNPKDA
jgi:VanZ family protein